MPPPLDLPTCLARGGVNDCSICALTATGSIIVKEITVCVLFGLFQADFKPLLASCASEKSIGGVVQWWVRWVTSLFPAKLYIRIVPRLGTYHQNSMARHADLSLIMQLSLLCLRFYTYLHRMDYKKAHWSTSRITTPLQARQCRHH